MVHGRGDKGNLGKEQKKATEIDVKYTHRESESARISHWLSVCDVVSLYGLGQHSPHELTFGVELGARSIFLTDSTP